MAISSRLQRNDDRDILPLDTGALSFCLKPVSIPLGKVVPRSQISSSFKILAYYAERYVS